MKEIKIFDSIGKNCISLSDGQNVYNLLFPLLSRGEEVVIDFSGVEIFASPFFNAAIGQLYKDFDSETLNRLLKVQNLSSVGRGAMKRSADQAKKYYKEQGLKEIIDNVINEQMEI